MDVYNIEMYCVRTSTMAAPLPHWATTRAFLVARLPILLLLLLLLFVDKIVAVALHLLLLRILLLLLLLLLLPLLPFMMVM